MSGMAEVLASHHALDFEDARPMDIDAEQASQLRWMVEWKCVCGAPLEHDPTTPATADETLIKAHAAHQTDMLAAAGFGLMAEAKDQALGGMLTDEALEHARKLVEDELVEWRDEGRFMLRNNGLAIRNKDGSGSEIIRFGFELALRMVINDHMATAERRKP